MGYRLVRWAENGLDLIQSDELILGKIEDLEWGLGSLTRIEPPGNLRCLVCLQRRLPVLCGDRSIPRPVDRSEREPLTRRQIHENMPSFAASIRFLSRDSSGVPSNSTGCRPSKAALGV